MNLQIAATNNTIAKNLYIPNWEAGTLELKDVNDEVVFDPQSTAQLCLVFKEGEAHDV